MVRAVLFIALGAAAGALAFGIVVAFWAYDSMRRN
jgi:hypothetical protein